MKKLRFLAGITLLPMLLLSGCALQDTIRHIDLGETLRVGKQAFGGVDEAQEIRIGAEASAVLLGASPLHSDTKLQGYVNRVGYWIALQSERPDLPWQFAVLDTDAINAFAAPGGYIFVTRGLLKIMQNEAELAGVLGHEIAHVVQKHHLVAVQKNARLNLAGMLVASQLEADRRAQMELLSNSFKGLYARGLDREDEFEADRMGVVLAARAGYDPYGLPAVLQTLGTLDKNASDLALLFKTHPPPDRRLERLAAHYSTLDRYANQASVANRFRQHTRVLTR